MLALGQQSPKLALIDVRTEREIALTGGMIRLGRRTHSINRGWLEFQIGDTIPNLDTPIVVYCGTNRRSPLAAATLRQMGYLEYLRGEIAQILDNGGSLVDAYQNDQSAYSHLDTFDELAGLNADRIYRAMEFE